MTDVTLPSHKWLSVHQSHIPILLSVLLKKIPEGTRFVYKVIIVHQRLWV